MTTFEITEIQTIKGCFYVIAVTFLIHVMIKSSNRKLMRSQEEYRDLFYNTPNPMLILNKQTGKFYEVNKAALETYGYLKEEFTNMTIKDVRANTPADELNINGGSYYLCEHKKKNNESIVCMESSRKISFKHSQATLFSTCDVTTLEKAKSELTQRENQLNQILNSITDGFFILNCEFVIEKANDLFKSFAGFSSDDIEGRKILDVFPGIIESGSYQQYMYAIQSQSAIHFESNYKDLKKWFRVSAYPFDNGLSVFFRDITKEKEDELQRHQNEQNLLALINNTKDLMWSVDCNFRYFIFNEPYKRNYSKIFGEEIYVGKSALNERHGTKHVQKWRSLYERALKGEKFAIDMNFLIDDSCKLAIARFNPIYDSNGNIIGVGCFLQDITERKLHERKIEKQNEQLRQIAFITSHQVRVPLANILGLAEILDSERPLSPANCKIIEHIKTSAKQLDRSIINMVERTEQAND